MLDMGQQRTCNLQEQEMQYVWAVLGLEDPGDENALDERLRSEAEELGLRNYGDESAAQASSKASSVETIASEQARRSDSICSETSQSTGLTSHYSDASKELVHRRSQVLQAFHDNDSRMARRSFPGKRASLQLTALSATAAQSTPSLVATSGSTSPRDRFRRLRGLSMLRLYRSDSGVHSLDYCPHCPKDFASRRRAVHTLQCGHKLCTAALRATVIAGQDQNALPSCCGIAIPFKLVKEVIAQTEPRSFMTQTRTTDDVESRALPSTMKSRESTHMELTREQASSDRSSEKTPDITSEQAVDLVRQTPGYQALRAEQEYQRDRFKAWSSKAHNALATQHALLHKLTEGMYEASRDAQVTQHASALSEAEDKQVKAESDKREAHAHEQRTNATALKHMEAYCAGRYSTGEPHHRIITDQDRAELEKTRRNRDSMHFRHASQINVLRGEQSRRIRLRIQRQEKEVRDLERQHQQQILQLQRQFSADRDALRGLAEEKRGRLLARWKLREMILMRRSGIEEDAIGGCLLPSVEWEGANKLVLKKENAGIAALRPRYDSLMVDEPGCVC